MIGRALSFVFLLAAAGVLPAPELGAQQPVAPELVDRVVAVVGDSVVLLSQVEQEFIRLQTQGVALPSDPEGQRELRVELVDALVNQLLILQAASGDSTLSVDDAELELIAGQELDRQLRQAGSQAALSQRLAAQGFSVSSYREFIKSEVRRDRLQQMYLQKAQATGGTVIVDEEEVRVAWETQRAQIPPLPASIAAYQVVVQPVPSDSARAAARVEAQGLLDQLVAGEDFETLARRFSQDPGSAQQGGDLGWFRRGTMVPEFEDAAFRLPENRLSDLVDTDHGVHIIKVERIRGGERKARHILVRAEVSDADRERARQRAAEVRSRVDAGEALTSLQEEYGMQGATALPDSIFAPLDQLDQFPEAYRALGTASPGDVIGPVEFDVQGSPYFAVIQVNEIREAGPRTFDDVKDQLRARLQEQRLMERIIQRLRDRSYVEIRM